MKYMRERNQIVTSAERKMKHVLWRPAKIVVLKGVRIEKRK